MVKDLTAWINSQGKAQYTQIGEVVRYTTPTFLPIIRAEDTSDIPEPPGAGHLHGGTESGKGRCYQRLFCSGRKELPNRVQRLFPGQHNGLHLPCQL